MREFAVTVYLVGFNFLFTIFKCLPLQKKVTFVISFPENALYIYEQMKHEKNEFKPVFLCHPRCYDIFKATGEKAYLFETKNIGHTLKGIFHLASSEKVVVDNYYGFLSAINFKKNVKCAQIWHAAGAIKQFGILDPSNKNRTLKAVQRFKQVYEKFDPVVVGSDFMADLYKKAFLTKSSAFLKTGVPRTDFFYQEEKMNRIRQELIQANPYLKSKKVILYAPTFRKDEVTVKSIALDIAKMYEALKDDYVLILKLHPKVTNETNFSELYPNFVFDYGSYPRVNDLLVLTDVLISDYSSIPMEFALLKRKMIFYAYDLESYEQASGFWEDYKSTMPGPVVKTTESVIEAILNEEVDHQKIQEFSEKWNSYSKGNASELFVKEFL